MHYTVILQYPEEYTDGEFRAYFAEVRELQA